jgi:hypothetical protein
VEHNAASQRQANAGREARTFSLTCAVSTVRWSGLVMPNCTVCKDTGLNIFGKECIFCRGGVETLTDNQKDACEIENIADYFRRGGMEDHAEFLLKMAVKIHAAEEFFDWFNKTYQQPSNHDEHPWCKLGLLLNDYGA